MIGIDISDSVLNGVYDSYTAKINNLVSTVYFQNADTYTGKSAMETYLRSSIAENEANSESVEEGTDLVKTNQGYVSDISDRLDQMKVLAEDAASGSYSASEVADMQSQFEALAEEIDDIAQGPLGETHILTEDGMSESVFVGSGISIQIDTHDMDSDSGLGLGSVDMTSDADAAVSSIEAAISEVEAYAADLEGNHISLEASAAALELQSGSLLAVESAVESTNSAMIMAGIISAGASSTANYLMLAQANSMTETVLRLLAD
jgi:flagellin